MAKPWHAFLTRILTTAVFVTFIMVVIFFMASIPPVYRAHDRRKSEPLRAATKQSSASAC
jgi:hypothetical protein